jgi:hypothetical protein
LPIERWLGFFIRGQEDIMRANRYILITMLSVTFLFFALWQTALAGPPEKPDNPGVPGLLAKISELNAQIAELEAVIQELEDFASVPQTGQITSYHEGDDGYLQKGIPWPDQRFTDNENGTVTDNLTGLIWLKNANCFGVLTWADALSACNTLTSPTCGLTDGSVAGDWRLPNRKELESLLDFSDDVALPFGPPFVNFGIKYWTSTSWVGQQQAWFIEYNGVVDATLRTVFWSVWPVRGGN